MMGRFLGGMATGLALALLIGSAADSSGRNQCERISHVKACDLIYVPAAKDTK
jgi:hypothetical protein